MIGQEALERSNWEEKVFPVTLTSAEIEDSPGIETDLPFSLQKEKELRLFFKWREYWNDEVFIQRAGYPPLGEPGTEAVNSSPQPKDHFASRVNGNPHLRSANEVEGYAILAKNGDIGHVENFIVSEPLWNIRYLVVDTRNWLPGKKVLISPKWVSSIDWSQQTVEVEMTRETIEGSPEYEPNKPISKEYEARLFKYYGKPQDWE